MRNSDRKHKNALDIKKTFLWFHALKYIESLKLNI